MKGFSGSVKSLPSNGICILILGGYFLVVFNPFPFI